MEIILGLLHWFGSLQKIVVVAYNDDDISYIIMAQSVSHLIDQQRTAGNRTVVGRRRFLHKVLLVFADAAFLLFLCLSSL
jgi:hypothetical protein